MLTRERFTGNPLTGNDEDRVYRTGDLGRYLPDGNVEFAGRRDGQVKLRGFRLELGEIEAALRDHAMIRDAAVILRDNGGAEQRLVAYVTGVLQQDLDALDLRDFLAQQLPEYAVPAIFVALEALPLTPNGKLNHNALPAPMLTSASPSNNESPMGTIEDSIAEIWKDLLGISSVQAYDNFYDLGGHSLMALKVVVRIDKQLGVRIAPAHLKLQTLRQLAEVCNQTMQSSEQSRNTGFFTRVLQTLRLCPRARTTASR